MTTIDDKDKMILYELDSDARQTYKQLSKKTGLSKDIVIYRVNKLIKEKIIDGFYTVIDTSKLGKYTIRCYLTFQNTSSEDEKEIIDYVTKIKNSLFVARATGSWDIIFGIWCKSIHEFDELWRKFENKYRKYIGQKNISIFLKFLHFRRGYLQPDKMTEDFTNAVSEIGDYKLDKTNKKILSLLSENARMPLIELSNKVGITPKAVNYRIKQLIKDKIILSYRAKVNLSAIGMQYYKVDVKLENLNRLKELETFGRLHPNIIYSERTLGGSDFELDIEAHNHEEFEKILTELKEKLGHEIRDISYYLSTKIYKTIYFPV